MSFNMGRCYNDIRVSRFRHGLDLSRKRVNNALKKPLARKIVPISAGDKPKIKKLFRSHDELAQGIKNGQIVNKKFVKNLFFNDKGSHGKLHKLELAVVDAIKVGAVTDSNSHYLIAKAIFEGKIKGSQTEMNKVQQTFVDAIRDGRVIDSNSHCLIGEAIFKGRIKGPRTEIIKMQQTFVQSIRNKVVTDPKSHSFIAEKIYFGIIKGTETEVNKMQQIFVEAIREGTIADPKSHRLTASAIYLCEIKGAETEVNEVRQAFVESIKNGKVTDVDSCVWIAKAIYEGKMVGEQTEINKVQQTFVDAIRGGQVIDSNSHCLIGKAIFMGKMKGTEKEVNKVKQTFFDAIKSGKVNEELLRVSIDVLAKRMKETLYPLKKIGVTNIFILKSKIKLNNLEAEVKKLSGKVKIEELMFKLLKTQSIEGNSDTSSIASDCKLDKDIDGDSTCPIESATPFKEYEQEGMNAVYVYCEGDTDNKIYNKEAFVNWLEVSLTNPLTKFPYAGKNIFLVPVDFSSTTLNPSEGAFQSS